MELVGDDDGEDNVHHIVLHYQPNGYCVLNGHKIRYHIILTTWCGGF